MLTENTGRALCDSGDAYGRHWERNQNKTIEDFEAMPQVNFRATDDFSVSTYHYLTKQAGLELNELCEEYNSLKIDPENGYADCEAYGVTEEGLAWLNAHGVTFGGTFNTYNGDWLGDQTLQGTYVRFGGSTDQYLLLQVHGGCDVRGGYTDAKLFYLPDDYMRNPEIEAVLNDKRYSTRYNGYALTVDDEDCTDEQMPEPKETDELELYLTEQ